MDGRTCAVCNGQLHSAEELTSMYDGEVYRFCSDEHLKEFNEMPKEFVY